MDDSHGAGSTSLNGAHPEHHQLHRTSSNSFNHSAANGNVSPNGSDDDHDNWSGNEAAASPGDNSPDDSRKRKRPMSVSCELCKQRKVKCDRGQPSCGWCVKNGQLCEYKERKKPGLRAGYGRELEARLDRLEDILQQQQNVITSLAQNVHSGAVTQHHQQNSPQDGPMFRSPPLVQTPHIPRPETALFLQKPSSFPSATTPIMSDFASSMGPRQTPAMSHGTAAAVAAAAAYQQSMAGDSLSQNGLNTPSRDSIGGYSHANGPIESSTLSISSAQSAPMQSSEHDFPPYDLLYALADLYFKHINPWCPILHRRSTLDSLFGPSTLDDGDRVLLHAMVATTLRFSTDPRLTPENRDKYHEISKQKVLLYGLENSSVKALQALVILALDLVGLSNGPPGWNLLALITRSVVQLGLAVESTSTMVAPQYPSIYTLRALILPEPRDWIEEESRRRLFWMVYLLDRYATVATAFEFALDEREIDRQLPCRDDLFARNTPVETRWFHTPERTDYEMDKPENLGSFSYYIEVIGLLSRIHQFLKKPVDIGSLSDVEKWQGEYRELDNALMAWKFSLPNEYGNMTRIFGSGSSNKIVNTGWIMLHAAYNTTVIRLHSSAAYPTTRSPIFTPSYSASQRCLSAVENIISLIGYLKTTSLLPTLGPPFAFSLWVAARVLLVHGSTISQNVNPSIHTLVATLRSMGQHWRVAERYAALLTRVLDEYEASASAAAGPTSTVGERRPSIPSTVRILADMRRCAYDLDVLISRQPRTAVAALSSSASGAGSAAGAGGAAGASRMQSMPTSLTSAAKAPQPGDFEYLDVFDFFNVPRLPVSMEGMMVMGGGVSAGPVENGVTSPGSASGLGLQTQQQQQQQQQQQAQQHHQQQQQAQHQHQQEVNGGNEFNITNFSFDANSDWFVKQT